MRQHSYFVLCFFACLACAVATGFESYLVGILVSCARADSESLASPLQLAGIQDAQLASLSIDIVQTADIEAIVIQSTHT